MDQRRLQIVLAVGGMLVVSGAAALQAATQDDVMAAAKKVNVKIDVKDTDISRVLDAFSQQTGLSVVIGKKVTGAVSVRLIDIPWDQALDAILKPYGYGYERTGQVIVVLPLDKLQATNEAQPLTSRVFQLRYVDAGDIKPVIEAQLSARGRVQVLEITGQKGWDFGAFGSAGSGSQASRSAVGGVSSPQRSYKGSSDRRSQTKTMVVTDIPAVLEQVANVITVVDVMPQQILIQARFMEVSRDRLKDLGLDIGTGSSGASTDTVEGTPISKKAGNTQGTFGAQSLGGLVAPAAFNARSSDIDKVLDFDTGLSLAFRKLTGTQFEVILHALEEDVHTNTLSAPSIMTLDNQEANILVGTQYPILTSTVAGTTSTTTVSSLDYYQDIGIQLRVVPQIAGDDHIHMIVHPAVTSIASLLTAQGTGGVTVAEYPIITTREAETQIMMKNGETIMTGGLLKDVKTKGVHKVPLLGDIPILGLAFQRRTDDVEKVDLLIFITAKIANDNEIATEEPVFKPSEPGSTVKVKWKKGS